MVLVISVNFIFMSSIALIWGLINSLELVIFLPLVNLNFPAQIALIYSIFIPMTTMDIVPEEMTLKFFNLSNEV
jgi:hypothetical protein